MSTAFRSSPSSWIVWLATACVLPTLACGAARGRRSASEETGFLRDYSELKEREGYEAADTATTVGTATLEAELVDSTTGEGLAVAVDQRAGTKQLLTTRTFTTWGDVEPAANFWAERTAHFLVEQDVRRKAG
jgi:hypothetical protein